MSRKTKKPVISMRKNSPCPVCGSKKYQHFSYYEMGLCVEERGWCPRCLYIVDACYSRPIYGNMLSNKRGYRDYYGVYRPKNVRRLARLKRRYGIKHTENDWWLSKI